MFSIQSPINDEAFGGTRSLLRSGIPCACLRMENFTLFHQPGPAPEEELDPTMASKKSKTTKKAKKGKR